MLLAVIHRMCMPSMMRSLAGNCTASYKHPDTMIKECKDALPRDLLAQLKRFLRHHNPTKFVGYVTVEQRRQDRASGNHASVANNIPKVESTLNKEERNKCIAVFPCWLEQFFPDLRLAPQGLICK